MTQQEMQGRVALVTGAGNGIGRAIALRLAEAGAIVGVNDLDEALVAHSVAAITARGGRAFGVVQNVASHAGITAAVEQCFAQGGRFDILVNNAAWVRYQALEDIRPETIERMLDIGFKAVIWGMQAAAARMDPARGGAIVNIASMVAFRSPRETIAYSGIKAGLLGMTRAAAAELGVRNIRVNAVCPSAIPTEGTERMRSPERDAQRAARTPLGRLGTPADIADAVHYLASDSSAFVTGQALLVDGGISFSDL